ncbi:MAG: MFS transporter [Planctomycetota bacterium]
MARAIAELFGHGRGRVLAFCWLGWVFDFFDLILFVFLERAIAADLGLSKDTDIALVQAATFGATAVGGFLFGRLADRRGRRLAITLSILVFSLGAFATSFAQGFWGLLAARIVTGIGVGGEWGVGHAIVAETYPERLRARAAGVLQAGAPIAMGLAAAVACFSGLHWRTLFLLAALPALLAFVARWAMPGVDRAPGHSRGGLLDLFRGALARPSAAIFTLLLLHMTGFWCTYAWLPARLFEDFGADVRYVGWFFIGVNSVHVVGDVLFGFLADRFGRRRMFVLFCLLFAAGLAAVNFGFAVLQQDPVLFGLCFAAIGLGAGTWSCFGVLFAHNFPEAVRATAAAGFYNLARGLQFVTQPLMGWLFAVTGTFAAALHVGVVMSVLSALTIAWVPRTEPTRDYDPSRPPLR